MTKNGAHAQQDLISKVTTFYEMFPYPQYPILARPKFQDGYSGASKFSGKLYENLMLRPAAVCRPLSQVRPRLKTILLGGSGEALPYVIRRLEPGSHRLLCVDLSETSLKRAKLRLLGRRKQTDFIRSDINHYLLTQGAVTGPYDHIDLYGVLHHLPDPSLTLKMLESRLSPFGTMRLMVYNSHARNWIRQIQSITRSLQLDPYSHEDRQILRRFLKILGELSPAAARRLSGMGLTTLNHDARLADTFFHVREAYISPGKWLDMMKSSGLRVFGLFDRYGELDDLENPLWSPPCYEALLERIQDYRFENNLELYICRADEKTEEARNVIPLPETKLWDVLPLLFRLPPARWFSYPETKDVGFITRYKIWHRHVSYISGYRRRAVDDLISDLPISTAQRLARIGAIMPLQIQNIELRRKLNAPMVSHMQSPETYRPQDFRLTPISQNIMEIMQSKGNYSERRYHAIMERLYRSQF